MKRWKKSFVLTHPTPSPPLRGLRGGEMRTDLLLPEAGGHKTRPYDFGGRCAPTFCSLKRAGTRPAPTTSGEMRTEVLLLEAGGHKTRPYDFGGMFT